MVFLYYFTVDGGNFTCDTYGMVTKKDLTQAFATFGRSVGKEIGGLRKEMSELRKEMNVRFGQQTTETKDEIEKLRIATKKDIDASEGRMKEEITQEVKASETRMKEYTDTYVGQILHSIDKTAATKDELRQTRNEVREGFRSVENRLDVLEADVTFIKRDVADIKIDMVGHTEHEGYNKRIKRLEEQVFPS